MSESPKKSMSEQVTSPLAKSAREGTGHRSGSTGWSEGVDSAHLMNSNATWGSIKRDSFSTSSITILNGGGGSGQREMEMMVDLSKNYYSLFDK